MFSERNTSTLKNDYNSLSSENLNYFPYIQTQKFLTSNIIKTQFRSNYTTTTATLTDENGANTNLPVTKKTTNLGRTLAQDCLYYNYKGQGVYTGIYFINGGLYTYNTITPSTGSYILNGDLPEFAIIGQTIQIWNGAAYDSYTIARIVYDEDVDSNVILINNIYTGVQVNKIVQSQYDISEYEIYEFDANFSAFLNNCYITLVNSQSGKPTITFRSELLDIQVIHPKTLQIIYYNTKNDDIMYSTGITHKLLIPFYNIVAFSENENEINITDTTAILIDSNINEKNRFTFSELSVNLMRKLKIALSSKIVIINDEGYIVGGTLNEQNINNTNLYTLEATMQKTGVVYNTSISAAGFTYTLNTII